MLPLQQTLSLFALLQHVFLQLTSAPLSSCSILTTEGEAAKD